MQSCPIGAVCDGSNLTGKVEGSVWMPDYPRGIYRLTSCPEGHMLVNSTSFSSIGEFSYEQQQCVKCTVGLQYILNPNVHTCQVSFVSCHQVGGEGGRLPRAVIARGMYCEAAICLEPQRAHMLDGLCVVF